MSRAVILALFASACGDNATQIPLACDGVVDVVRGEPGLHVAVGSPIEGSTNPPATGKHYPVWARWDHHYTSLERGFWLHNAEHGGIVLLYRCPDGCPDVVASLLDVARSFDTDSSCAAPVRNRLIVAADPLLPPQVQVAAVGWNVTYTASCFDPFVATFAAEHYNEGPEDLCNDGADRGGTIIDP